MNSRRSWLIFALGSFAYVSAVLQRTSLGVAGVASFVSMFLIGVLLDLQDGWRVAGGAESNLYELDAFRAAFAVQFLVVGIGVVFLVLARRRTRRQLSRDEGIEVAPLWVALSRAWSRRRGAKWRA